MARSSLSRPVVPDITGSSVDRRQRGYERHRPEETLLNKLVAEHLETFLANPARSTTGHCRRTSSGNYARTCAAGSWRMGAQSQTEYVGRSSPLRRVAVTRRHHPAEGKTFEVVTGGRNQIVIRLDDESTMRIPRLWTDADGTREGMDAPEHIFTPDALRTLRALVASLVRRSSPEGEEASDDRVAAPTSGGDT